MNAEAITTSFAKRFQSLRRRYVLLSLGIWLSLLLATALTIWLVSAAYDYFFEASVGLRRIILAVAALAIISIAIPSLIKLLEKSRQYRFANLLEKTFCEFGQRLRTTLDVLAGRVRGPDAMLGALANQTLGRWETVQVRQILPTRGFFVSLGALLVLSLGVLTLTNSASHWRTAMLRAAGNDASYTDMKVYPGDKKVLEGADGAARLELIGRPRRDVAVRYRTTKAEGDLIDNEWIEASLVAKNSEGSSEENLDSLSYEIHFGKMNEDVEYQFKTSVGTTPLYRLSVQPLIRATSISIAAKSPSYTRVDERTYTTTDVTVLKGSEVRVTLATNHPLTTAKLKIGASKSTLQDAQGLNRGEKNTWTFNLPCDVGLHWSFEGTGQSEIPMEGVTGRLRIRDDVGPSLFWRSPSDGFQAHALAELPMNVVATDDYGLKKVGIVFQLGEEEFVLKEWSQSASDSDYVPSSKITLEQALPLESFQLTEHEYVSYYAYAVDNCEDNPHRIETDIRYIDIRPFRQTFALADEQPGEFAGEGQDSLRQPLSEIIRRQRFVINRTKRFARALPNDPTIQLSTVDRLVENQSELASLVRFLASELAERGSDGVEALGQAEALMLQAADSLSAAEFSTAFTQENDALRALVEAKNQVEITLSKNSQTMQQMRRMRELARQLRQRLRMDQPRLESQIADSLEALARDQSQITDQITTLLSDSKPDDAALSKIGDGKSSEEAVARVADEQAIEDEIKKQQLDLHDRFTELISGLEKQTDNSALLARRVKSANALYDELERAGDWKESKSKSENLTVLLVETALHVRALAPVEPVARISELRGMAAAMGSFERQLSNRLPRIKANDNLLEGLDQSFEMLSSAAIARSETATDVLQIPVDIGDVETSEVNDSLAQFVAQTKFKELLESSRTQFQDPLKLDDLSEKDVKALSEEAFNRSGEYHEAARLLAELYQKLMTPKLDQLRQLEEETSQLADMMSNQASDGAEKDDEMQKEINAALKKLKDDIQDAGLENLLAILQPTEPAEGTTKALGMVGNDYTLNIAGEGRGNPQGRRVHTLLHELRGRIQQMILMEISPDRDIPVPHRYKQAVDKYFERIAGATNDPNTEQP